jgi:hypothetical protein
MLAALHHHCMRNISYGNKGMNNAIEELEYNTYDASIS